MNFLFFIFTLNIVFTSYTITKGVLLEETISVKDIITFLGFEDEIEKIEISKLTDSIIDLKGFTIPAEILKVENIARSSKRLTYFISSDDFVTVKGNPEQKHMLTRYHVKSKNYFENLTNFQFGSLPHTKTHNLSEGDNELFERYIENLIGRIMATFKDHIFLDKLIESIDQHEHLKNRCTNKTAIIKLFKSFKDVVNGSETDQEKIKKGKQLLIECYCDSIKDQENLHGSNDDLFQSALFKKEMMNSLSTILGNILLLCERILNEERKPQNSMLLNHSKDEYKVKAYKYYSLNILDAVQTHLPFKRNSLKIKRCGKTIKLSNVLFLKDKILFKIVKDCLRPQDLISISFKFTDGPQISDKIVYQGEEENLLNPFNI